MIPALLLILSSGAAPASVAAYGPVTDPRTGKQCPATQYKLGLWDEADFQPADLMTVSGNEVYYCTRLRANLLEAQRKKSSSRVLSRR